MHGGSGGTTNFQRGDQREARQVRSEAADVTCRATAGAAEKEIARLYRRARAKGRASSGDHFLLHVEWHQPIKIDW
jgi:hypothetical protein